MQHQHSPTPPMDHSAVQHPQHSHHSHHCQHGMALSNSSNSRATVVRQSGQSLSKYHFIEEYPTSQVFNHLLMQISSEIDHEYEDTQEIEFIDEDDLDPTDAHHEESKQQFGDGHDHSNGDSRQIHDISTIYEIEQQLGDQHYGLNSCVHKVRHTENGKYYALKSLPKQHPDSKILFDRERESLNMLQGHRNIVELFDALEDDEHFYIVTPLLESTSTNN